MTRDEMRRNQQLPHVDPVNDGVILALWRKKYDTADIARLTKLSEHQIYNRLLHIRGAARG